MPSLSEIKKTVRSLTVESPLFNTSIKIRYYPGVFTPSYQRDVQEKVLDAINRLDARNKERDAAIAAGKEIDLTDVDLENPPEIVIDHAVESLCGLIESWDITDDNGINMPIESAVLAQIPYPILHVIFQAIREDMSPKPESSSS